MSRFIGIIVVALFFGTAVEAKHNSNHPLSAEDWKEVMDKVVLLENSGLIPTLLPMIMSNRDALQLTDEQVSLFRGWRKKNYTRMVNIMNEIIEKKVQFRIESLSPDIAGDHLLGFQAEIQELQRQLLMIKLSCRQLVFTTFTDEQWESFAFIASDHPKLASLMPHVNNASSKHAH